MICISTSSARTLGRLHSGRYERRLAIFVDAGRGLARSGRRGGDAGYARSGMPPLSTFRTTPDVGIDMRLIGFFVAKALSDANEPVNFFVRLRHRF